MTLWGANGIFDTDQISAGYYYDDQTPGMDLRIKMSQLPAPASLMLIGIGLLEFGFRRFAPDGKTRLN
ncbi:MAG: PEP-CTERM sorting domain-containing protein [Gammaproteobacteria bacterium]|nr:PEP-CTERM sorting domain-containing protein [Gammaproteobacteria bacterium]